MATIVNNPPPSTSDSSAVGVVAGVIIAVIIVILFIIFGLPYFRTPPVPNTSGQPTNTSYPSANINVQIPVTGTSTP